MKENKFCLENKKWWDRKEASYTHSLNKYLLSTYYALGTVLGPGETEQSHQHLAFMELTPVGGIGGYRQAPEQIQSTSGGISTMEKKKMNVFATVNFAFGLSFDLFNLKQYV